VSTRTAQFTPGKGSATTRRPRVTNIGTDDGLCHPHVVPAKVMTTDPDGRRRAWEQSIRATHKRWAKVKVKRKMARRSRKANR